MWEKLKSFLADDALFTAMLVVLVGVVAFGLGRQSIVNTEQVITSASQPAVSVSQLTPPQSENSPEKMTVDTVRVVASRSGTKYHLPDCPGAKQIKEENKVWFESLELAKAAGYSAAANCAGLE